MLHKALLLVGLALMFAGCDKGPNGPERVPTPEPMPTPKPLSVGIGVLDGPYVNPGQPQNKSGRFSPNDILAFNARFSVRGESGKLVTVVAYFVREDGDTYAPATLVYGPFGERNDLYDIHVEFRAADRFLAFLQAGRGQSVGAVLEFRIVNPLGSYERVLVSHAPFAWYLE